MIFSFAKCILKSSGLMLCTNKTAVPFLKGSVSYYSTSSFTQPAFRRYAFFHVLPPSLLTLIKPSSLFPLSPGLFLKLILHKMVQIIFNTCIVIFCNRTTTCSLVWRIVSCKDRDWFFPNFCPSFFRYKAGGLWRQQAQSSRIVWWKEIRSSIESDISVSAPAPIRPNIYRPVLPCFTSLEM